MSSIDNPFATESPSARIDRGKLDALERRSGALRKGAASGDRDKEMWSVAEGFEEIFLNIVLKSGNSGEFAKDGFPEKSSEGEAYQDMYYSELSHAMSKRHDGLGIAKMVYDFLSRQTGGTTDAPTTAPRPSAAPRVTPAIYRSAGSQAQAIPVAGTVSSPFGMRRHPITDQVQMHEGTDIAAPAGSPIRAFRDGVVEYAGRAEGYGNIVVLRHADGMKTLYGHNQENLVQAGDRVRAGQTIGRVGSTGRSTGPHLHFEIVREGERVDPSPYLKQRSIPGNRGTT